MGDDAARSLVHNEAWTCWLMQDKREFLHNADRTEADFLRERDGRNPCFVEATRDRVWQNRTRRWQRDAGAMFEE